MEVFNTNLGIKMELTKRKVVCNLLSFMYILLRDVIDSLLASMKTKVTYKTNKDCSNTPAHKTGVNQMLF